MAPVGALPNGLSARSLLQAAATNLHPTRTLAHLVHLEHRQTQTTTTPATVTIVTGDNPQPADNDPNGAHTLTGGAIAGIVIGSIAGFLLLVWIIRSCTNLGAPPGDDAVPGKPWYGGVRDEYPPRHVRGRSRNSRRSSYGHSAHHHHHHHGSHSRSRSRRVSVVEPVEVVPVREVPPVVVRDGRSRSRGRDARGYYGYGDEPVRGSRSRSRGRY